MILLLKTRILQIWRSLDRLIPRVILKDNQVVFREAQLIQYVVILDIPLKVYADF